MGDYNKDEWGLGNKSESLMDAPKLGWGERMMSKKDREKINPPKELGEWAAEKDAERQVKENVDKENQRKTGEQNIQFTGGSLSSPPSVTLPHQPVGIIHPFPRTIEPSSVDHEWKVKSTEGGWKTEGGTIVYINEGRTVVVPAATVIGEAGWVYLAVNRDPSSRAAGTEVVEYHSVKPTSTEATQYFELAVVGGTPKVAQTQFTPIRVFEDLAVVNGEFKLVNLAIYGDNFYDLPV